MNDYATIKIDALRIQEDYPEMNKVIGCIDANNFANLIDVVGLQANPREAQANAVTAAILETLQYSPHLLIFKNKGVLIATTRCISTEQRQIIKLSFNDKQHEGILDGGHTLFAIAFFILKTVGHCQQALKSVKTWQQLIYLWQAMRNTITREQLNQFTFKLPIEIICPKSTLSYQRFCAYVCDIAVARNNNTQLNSASKAGHHGYYDYLKNCLPVELRDKVAWKQNETGKSIKGEDIIILALIPLYALQSQGGLPTGIPKISPTLIYGNKAKGIAIVNDIINYFLANKQDLSNECKSALAMLYYLPKLHDIIEQRLPQLLSNQLNLQASPNKKYFSKYYQYPLPYTVANGFIFPILFGLHCLMYYDLGQKQLLWRSNPELFLNTHLKQIDAFCALIQRHNQLADKVGKDSNAYRLMTLSFMAALNE